MDTPKPSEAQQYLDAQEAHWESTFSQKAEMFGAEPSEPARWAAELFKQEGSTKLLELGAGQGRDTLFFAQSGFHVTALEYSTAGVEAIRERATALAVAERINALQHDIRTRFPLNDGVFDACYSHMLFCMALTLDELERLSQEVRRVLRPSGLNIYTVRHTGDPQYGTGVRRGEDMYEIGGGFIVHFLGMQQVRELSRGYKIVSVDDFEEGSLPKKLFRVTLRKD